MTRVPVATMGTRRAAASLVLALCAGCAGPSPSAPLPSTGTSIASSNPGASAAATPAPSTAAPSVEPTPGATYRPDLYPEWLVGSAYTIWASETTPQLLGRVGLPGRLELPANSLVLGVFGDRVMTVVPSAGQSVIQVLSFESGLTVANVTVEGVAPA